MEKPTVKEIHRNFHHVTINLKSVTDKLRLLFISDVHHDSKNCLRELLTKHLDEAKKKGALVFCFGDWFDIMGTKKDPRSATGDIRPEYLDMDKKYLNLVLNDSINFLEKYRGTFVFLGQGNHETAIARHNEVDVLDALIGSLNLKGEDYYKGGYSGFIRFRLNRAGSTACTTFTVAYHHGHGGGAKRSKGTLDIDLDAAMYPDANMVVKGHTHYKWQASKTRFRFYDSGFQFQDRQHHLRLGNYVDSIKDGYSGWNVEKNHEPLAPGGWWVDIGIRRMTSRPNETDVMVPEVEIFEAC